MAKTPRKWTGARTPSGLKRVRSAERRHAILGPRRTAAKTLVKAALIAATDPAAGIDPAVALAQAERALDRAARAGAIHPNAAARRKSRLALKMNAALGGTAISASHVTKTVGRAAAQKAAKARIAAGRAGKAKGAQTAAGKARAALSRTRRAETAGAAPSAAMAELAPAETTPAKESAKAPVKKSAAKKPATKAATKATAGKVAASKASAAKAPARKGTAKATPKA